MNRRMKAEERAREQNRVREQARRQGGGGSCLLPLPPAELPLAAVLLPWLPQPRLLLLLLLPLRCRPGAACWAAGS